MRDNKQLKIGTRVESEHKDVVTWLNRYISKHNNMPKRNLIYRHIAMTHLKEDPNYYKKLKKMEKR